MFFVSFIEFPQFRCIVDGKYQQAMGTAIECRRLDKLEEAISRSDIVQRNSIILHSCLSFLCES